MRLEVCFRSGIWLIECSRFADGVGDGDGRSQLGVVHQQVPRVAAVAVAVLRFAFAGWCQKASEELEEIHVFGAEGGHRV